MLLIDIVATAANKFYLRYNMSKFNTSQLIGLSIEEETTTALLKKHKIKYPCTVKEGDPLYTKIMEKTIIGKSKKHFLADCAPNKKISHIKIDISYLLR